MGLAGDRRLRRALEAWQPAYVEWWKEVGPEGLQTSDIYLRTAIDVDTQGWAHYDFVKMPEYRWGIFLAPPAADRVIGFGDRKGEPVWQEVPGEHRGALRRIITVQGDTEPASVEQQRRLGATCPSLYDLRALLQVNVEEGRHLWAMVYLLHAYFGRDGRDEAEALLERRSGDEDRPRILGAFNEATRTGSRSSCSPTSPTATASSSSPRSRNRGSTPSPAPAGSCSRRSRTTCTSGNPASPGSCSAPRTPFAKRRTRTRARSGSSIPRPSRSTSTSTTRSPSTSSARKSRRTRPTGTRWASRAGTRKGGSTTTIGSSRRPGALLHPAESESGAGFETREVPALGALNERLRDDFIADVATGIRKWNRIFREAGVDCELALPHRAFNRHIGLFAGVHVTPAGECVSEEEWRRRADAWLPTARDREYVSSLMPQAVHEPGRFANWIAPPARGIDRHPVEFEYIRFA